MEREEFPENGTILYTQFVMLGDTEADHFPESNLGYVNAAAHIKTLECRYRQSEVIRTEVETFADQLNSAVGSFDVQLLIYTDDTYAEVVELVPLIPGKFCVNAVDLSQRNYQRKGRLQTMPGRKWLRKKFPEKNVLFVDLKLFYEIFSTLFLELSC